MVDETTKVDTPATPAPVATPVISEAELMKQLDVALKSGDFKEVSKVSSEIVKFKKTAEQAELEAKQKALEAVTETVKTAIQKALKPMYDEAKLDLADGVWFSWDFGEQLVAVKLLKTQAKARTGGGGGGGKKFAITTNAMLEKFGGQEYKDGATYQAAWDADTDKNKRYAIRESLLK